MGKRPPHRDYEVGYGKPPRDRQFKKGQSGNPKGRPKKEKSKEDKMSFDAIVSRALQRKVTLTQGGKQREASAIEAIVERIVAKLLAGEKVDPRIIKMLRELSNQAEAQVSHPIDYFSIVVDRIEAMAARRDALKTLDATEDGDENCPDIENHPANEKAQTGNPNTNCSESGASKEKPEKKTMPYSGRGES